MTIVVAIVSSAFFLAADPFSLKRNNLLMADQIRELERTAKTATGQLQNYQQDISQLRARLLADEQKLQKASAEAKQCRIENESLRNPRK